ncbi:MAG: hypothetical protein AAF235_10730, partial [Planctomycetota bacterium]
MAPPAQPTSDASPSSPIGSFVKNGSPAAVPIRLPKYVAADSTQSTMRRLFLFSREHPAAATCRLEHARLVLVGQATVQRHHVDVW